MSIMPNEPLVRLAPASDWNLKNELTGWRLFSGTRAKPLLSRSFDISLFRSVYARNKCSTHDLHFLFYQPSLCAYAPYMKQTTMEWVMVSESRLSFINDFKLSGVSGWWIVRHIIAVLCTRGALFSPVMSCLSPQRMYVCNTVSGTAHPNTSAVWIITVAQPFTCRALSAKLAEWLHAL